MNKRTYITFAFVMTMLGSITAQEEPNIIHQTNCSNEIVLASQAQTAPDSIESASGNRQNPPEAAGPSGSDLVPPSGHAQVTSTKLAQDTEQDSAYTEHSNNSVESVSSNRHNPTEAAGPSGPDLVPPSDQAQIAPTELTQDTEQDSAYSERHDGEESLQSDQPNNKSESRAALYKKGILGLCSTALGIVGNCLPLIVTLKGQSTYQEVPRAHAKHLINYKYPGSLVALWATHAVSTALIIAGARSIKNAYEKLKQTNAKRMEEPAAELVKKSTVELEEGDDNQEHPAEDQNNLS